MTANRIHTAPETACAEQPDPVQPDAVETTTRTSTRGGVLDRLGRFIAIAGAKGRLIAGLALIGVCYLRFIDPTPLTTARHQVLDLFQRLAPRPPIESQVIVIDVDEDSIAELGQWPWSRDRMADMVRNLDAAGVAAIGFDMVFSEPDRLSPTLFAAEARGVPAMLRGALSNLPDTDAVFADALRDAPAVLGMSGAVDGLTAPGATPTHATETPAFAPMAAYRGDPTPFIFGFPGLLRNVATLEEAAAGVGLFNLAPEHDGVVRRVPAALRIGDGAYATLSLEMLRVAREAGSTGIIRRPDGAGIEGVRVGDLTAPTDENGRIWLRFARHDPSIYLSAKDVIAGTVDPARIAGKYALVGSSAVGLRDLRMTPLEQSLPGVEVHAQLIDAILTGQHLSRPAEALGAEMLATLLIGALMIAALPRLTAAGGLPFALGAIALVWAAAYLAFDQAWIAIDPTFPSLAIIAVYAALAYSAYARAEAQRRQIRSAFTQYLSPDMVARLADDPESLRLGGESREMTFLFCDIAGFTSFVESADPEDLVRLLNEYLDGVCGIVMRHGGTVDKIVGDAVHAMFNAPLDDPRHAANAVEAALEIETFVDDFRARKAAEGVDFGRTRIGVNTGPAIVGNFGGSSRFDYTAHGDAINTAARLESVNKHLGTTICVAGATAALCPELAFRRIGNLHLKGKDRGVEALEPLRADAAEAPAIRAYETAFDRLAAATAESAAEIRAAFDALADQHPSDPLIALHQKRLADGQAGVDIRMTEK